MMHKHARKVPRYHPDLDWESRTLSNEFIDINRMALDDSFSGKNAAPLSKRRNGIGYTDNKTPGLFGLGAIVSNEDPRKTFLMGSLVAVGTYTIIDWATHKPNQTKFKRMIKRTPGSLIVGALALGLFSTSS
jgi:hypothetical protein|tara:strand:- start:557 stop:952 length:396 start_codon:yes stop_codon:yes gene_type:complete